MFEVVFLKVTVSKPNRYVFLLKTQTQTKRTDVSQEWTSTPQFASIAIEELAPLQLKLCEAGLDRKIRIVGSGMIHHEDFDFDGEVAFEGQVKLQQEVQGRQVCVGLAHLRISRQKKYEAIPEGATKQLKTQVSQVEDEEQDFQLDAQREYDNSQQDQDEEEDLLRVEVHCGFNFYLGSQFYVQTTWGRSVFRTRAIKDKISPLWAQGGRVSGKPSKPITISVKDSKGNILQSFKFSLSSLRTLFPYHIRMIFREEYLGATPEILFSLVRESLARHSITEISLRFGLRNVGEPVRNAMYLMISLSPSQKVPNFMTIDRSQNVSLQQANNFLTSRTLGEQERVQLVGLSNNQTPKGFSIFKSYLSRKLFMCLLMIPDAKSWFLGQNFESARVAQTRTDLETVLKKVYQFSQGQAFTIKKMLEFFNPNTIETADTEGKTVAQKWKLLTRNYILRNKMVNQSTKHIADLKEAIEKKGAELVQIKKILNEIKLINFSLVGKQKLMTAIKNRSRVGQKLFAKEIDTGGLISALYEKQAILQGQKRINAELAIRMDSLTSVQQTHQDLQRDLTQNAAKLLHQQESISRMKKMENAIKQQRLIIGQLQRCFEKGEMDRRVNQALRQQRERLQQLRQKKQQDLKKVYKIVKQNNQHTGNLFAKVKHAEETLVKLNEQYARLTSL